MWFLNRASFRQRRYRSPLHVLLMLSLFLSGCTITISPAGELSFLRQPGKPTAPADAASEAPMTPVAEPITNALSASSPFSIMNTLGWAISGRSIDAIPVTLPIAVDYIVAGRTLDRSFYNPEQKSGRLVDELSQYGITVDNVRLEYAVINNEKLSDPLPNPTWTLYYLERPTVIVSATHVLAYSTFQTGAPYTVTRMAHLTGASEATAGSEACGVNLNTAIVCLRSHLASAQQNLFQQPTAFLLLSTKDQDRHKRILAWFWILPNGTPLPPPDDDATLCEFCQQTCDGRGWCGWVCTLARC